jgi:glycosyltransferase involved in cell wall biosynthesis
MKFISAIIDFYYKHRNIKITVILPIYNAEKYLKQCLDSIVNQSLKGIEIIAVNDCSSDNSSRILSEYIKKHRSLKIINNSKNSGAGYSRNIAIKCAKGKYITFIDSDDWFGHDYLKQLYSEAESTKSDIVFSNMKYVDNNTESDNKDFYKLLKKYKSSSESISDLACDWPYTAPWMKLYNRDFIIGNNLVFLEGIKLGAEDIPFTWMSYFLAQKISFCDKAFYYYNTVPESLDRSVNEVVFEIFDALEFNKSKYFQADPKGERRPQLDAMYVSHLIYQFEKITYLDNDVNKKLASDFWNKAYDCFTNINPHNIYKYDYLPWRKKAFFQDVLKNKTFNTEMYIKYMAQNEV